jgi:uncharacterized integral membrane protein
MRIRVGNDQAAPKRCNQELAKPDGASPDRATQDPTIQPVYRGSGLVWSLVGGLVAAAVILIFIAQNTHRVALEFLWFDLTTPLAVLVLAVALLAVVSDEVTGVMYRSQRRQLLTEREELKRLRKRQRRTVPTGAEGQRSNARAR